MEGFEPTTLGETLGLSTAVGEFIQILHVSNNHWLTVANIGCPKGHVNVYDSILSGDITSRTKMQIAAIVYTHEKKTPLPFLLFRSRMVEAIVDSLHWHLRQHYVKERTLQRLIMYSMSFASIL